jgi:hypothetical protein
MGDLIKVNFKSGQSKKTSKFECLKIKIIKFLKKTTKTKEK